MRNLRNPKWIFFINTLPIILIFFFFLAEYNTIKSLLDLENIRIWRNFGIALTLLGLANILYAASAIINDKIVSAWYGLISLIVHIAFILSYLNNQYDFIPFTVPNWMASQELPLYVGTFLMPTLTYSLFVIIMQITPKEKSHSAWKNGLAAISIPIAWYLFHQTILPLWQISESSLGFRTALVLGIVSTVGFILLVARTIFIMSSRITRKNSISGLIRKIVLCIVLPILCLEINNGNISAFKSMLSSNMFGDFHNIWFYLLTILNGVLLCLPNIKNRNYRLTLLLGRSITLSFIVYFHAVFLPLLPLALIGIAMYGLGILLLVPHVVLIISARQLIQDFNYLSSEISNTIIKSVIVLGFILLPIIITTNNFIDKKTMTATLEFLYSPDYSKEYNIDTHRLRRTIKSIKENKARRGQDLIFNGSLPYLSTYYNWIVLDKLTLSNEKVNLIEQVFFGQPAMKVRTRNQASPHIEITDISVESTYDAAQSTWTSWIHLELLNNSQLNLQEYATTIHLPEGSWINNYYLYVGPAKEMGMLAEKKSAMWIYSMIRNTPKDPGILYYLTGNNVAFKVYPFGKEEKRETGIQLIHKEPIEVSIDGNKLKLGEFENSTDPIAENQHAIYISPIEKNNLPTTKRKPYYHFLVTGNDYETIHRQAEKIEQFRKTNQALGEKAKITFANDMSNHYSMDKSWKNFFKPSKHQGSFYAEYGIKSILYNAYNSGLPDFPEIILVCDRFDEAILQKDFKDWKFCFPDSDLFYMLDSNNQLQAHSLTDKPKAIVPDSLITPNQAVKIYKLENGTQRFLKDDQNASIVLKTNQVDLNIDDIEENSWEAGLSMQAKARSQLLNPDPTNREWIDQVRASFKSKIMSPSTSYIVLETEAQKQRLLKKQKEMLNGHKSLDASDEQRTMSEPELWILLLLMSLFVMYHKKKLKPAAMFN